MRLKIQAKGAGTDSIGFPNAAWSDVAIVWAEKRQERGSEMVKLGSEVKSEVARFFIRARSGLTTKHRFKEVLTSKNWNIKYIRELADRSGMEVLCELGGVD